jgi:phosphoribosylformimino-5-aminoimidazole carboxamide ribotide isomerase
MLIFPAVDIAGGRCVRLLQGMPDRETVYFERPADAARHWQDQGADALHVVDLDGALARDSNVEPVGRILQEVSVPVQVAGGLRGTGAVRHVLKLGAVRAVVGTRAARDPAWAIDLCADLPDRVVIALDARDGRLAIEGWQELADVGPVEMARTLAPGRPAAFLYTDVARDGMLTRPNFDGVEKLLEATSIPVIASGGVASLEDIRELGERGADAVIVGKALYEKRFALPEALEVAAVYGSRLAASPDSSAN